MPARIYLTPAQLRVLADMSAAGATAEQITQALGGAVSRATVTRRLRTLRGPVRARRVDPLPRGSAEPGDAGDPEVGQDAPRADAPLPVVADAPDAERVDLAAMAAELASVAEEARAGGNLAVYARLKGLELQAHVAARRQARLEVAGAGHVLVSVADIEAAAERARTKLRDALARAMAERGGGR